MRMRKRKLIHPRKLVWVMRDFLNKIHNITYETVSFPPNFDFSKGSILEVLDEGIVNKHKAFCKVIKSISPDHGFYAMVGDLGEEEFRIAYNVEDLSGKGHQQFTSNFRSRCPLAQGFADITLVLLHELGHFEAFEEIEGYDRVKAIKELEKTYPREIINFAYFNLPDETAATEWAIEWLQNVNNRKIAKDFEKKFFACFE